MFYRSQRGKIAAAKNLRQSVQSASSAFKNEKFCVLCVLCARFIIAFSGKNSFEIVGKQFAFSGGKNKRHKGNHEEDG